MLPSSAFFSRGRPRQAGSLRQAEQPLREVIEIRGLLDHRQAAQGVAAMQQHEGERPPREVRLIGGQWKRSKLPVADSPGLRPTPDRVRETLFNWLGQDLTGWRCLDPGLWFGPVDKGSV